MIAALCLTARSDLRGAAFTKNCCDKSLSAQMIEIYTFLSRRKGRDFSGLGLPGSDLTLTVCVIEVVAISVSSMLN